jgi:myo-inositol-1(or 4)-monophosphatase
MLNVAIKAAREAARIINRGAMDLDLVKVDRKGPNDFVSEIDRAAEAAIIDTLLTAYPSHGILAEESGREKGNPDSEFTWIIDPLDGTTNFLHGLPIYSVSIALAFRNVVQQAVVYDPCRNDLFFASRGRGAFLNDRRLRVSRRIRLADALVGTGFPFRRGDNFKRYLDIFSDVMAACAGLRRPGSAALDLCYVAAGWYDAFFEPGLSPWDVAAGSLIVTEAGGLVGNFAGEGDFLHGRELLAGSPKIYGHLVHLLSPHVERQRLAAALAASAEAAASGDTASAAVADALAATLDPASRPSDEPAPVRVRQAVRIRRADLPTAAKRPTPAATPAPAAAAAPAAEFIPVAALSPVDDDASPIDGPPDSQPDADTADGRDAGGDDAPF